jgi:cyclomaltodextrinase
MMPTMKTVRWKHRALCVLLTAALIATSLVGVAAQAPPEGLSKLPARPARNWVRDGVIYQIFPRAFSAEGNFKGIAAQLDRLKDLGVNILWLMPIHPIGQEKKKGTIGSPYAVRDYYAINPDYGTKEDLKRLVSESHRRGIKVIIDIVANHTAWDSVLMKHPEWYKRDASGKITYPYDWYDIAALDYNNKELRRYMIDMLKYWIREFDLDGFRSDVAGELPTDFWDNARTELDKVKPDIFMLAEAHKPELLVKAFELDYSWPLHSALTNVLQGRGRSSDLREAWEKEHREWPRGALHMRFSDNHDERRAIARFGEPGALAASALMFTLDGVPLIYNGMEVGDTTESGAPALFERLPIFWPIAARRPEFPRFYKQITALRQDSSALRRGSMHWLRNSDEARIVTYLRRSTDEEVFVALNLSNRPFFGSVEVANGVAFTDVTPDVGPPLPDAPAPERTARLRTNGLPALSIEAWGYRIFRRAVKIKE